MTDYFASGRAVDLVLAFIALELAVLVALGRSRITLLLATLPGAAMLLALRAALTGASWHWVALWLTVSLPLHFADLRHRRII